MITNEDFRKEKTRDFAYLLLRELLKLIDTLHETPGPVLGIDGGNGGRLLLLGRRLLRWCW